MRQNRFDFLEISEDTPDQAPQEEVGPRLRPVAPERETRAGTRPVPQAPGRGRLALLETMGELGDDLGRFRWPLGLAIDHMENVYVADTMRNRIQKITPNNEAYGYCGPGNGVGEISKPSDVAVDNRMFIYILEMGNHRITKLSQDGTYLGTMGSRGNGYGRLSSPEALCLDFFNNILVADTDNNLIQKLDARGRYLEQYAFDEIDGILEPRGVWASQEGEIIVCDTGNGRLVHADRSGRVRGVFAGNETVPLRSPVSACRDTENNIWVVDTVHDCVAKFAPDGTFLTRVGPDLGSSGRLNDPRGIVFGPDGDFYVADTGNHRLLRFGYREQQPRRYY
jgi:tripartite motif-containing protein 71